MNPFVCLAGTLSVFEYHLEFHHRLIILSIHRITAYDQMAYISCRMASNDLHLSVIPGL